MQELFEHTTNEEAAHKPNGLLIHEQVQLSPHEMRAERRLVWKIDLIILPLLSLMYFLASMVGFPLDDLFVVVETADTDLARAMTGPRGC